ncbi:MAG: leucine-rich repeat protein [Alistipes sp.]|nr:leucine-rich repeat protein [Alistipes sp.]
MRRVERLFKTLLGMSLAVSCTEYNEVMDLTTLPSETITIVASQEERKVETRTTLQSDGSVFWNPNDEISLFFNGGENGGNKFTSQNTETAEIAEFAGSIYGITGGGENLEGDAYFWAVYPYSENNSCDGTSIVTSLPSRQQAVEGSFNDDLFITVARSESVKMAFKNVCGGVKFCVKNSGIKTVTFCGNNNEKLAGEVRVAFDANNKPVVKEIIDGKSEITVDAPNNGTFEPGKYYYLITLPTELKSGFTMTFKKNDNTNIIYKRTSSVTINRSRFGVVSNLDTGTAVPDEEVAGGTESGFYLGIIGFNNEYFSYPIKHLSSKSINGYNSFIDGLSMTNGTLLYYAVDKSIDQLQAATFPSNLYDVSIVTFTDGLDRGSLDMSDNYLSNTEYLTALNTRLTEETVSNQDITSYTIGVRGDDVTNYTSFQNNLKKLATSSDNVFEVTNMSEVNEVFLQIADLLGEVRYYQKFMLEIKGPSHNEKCRFTFDNVSSYSASKCYIEGTFNRLDKSLTNVRYVGLTSTSGTVVNSVKNAQNFYVYTFEGLQGPNGELVPTEYVRHWYTEEGVWQKDSEFTFDPGTVSMEKIKRSAAILLNLDCSSSLGDKFVTLQTTAKSFIAKLLENSIDPYEVASVSLNKTNLSMVEGETETLKATVLPDTALQKDVEWSSTNSAVATVDQNGVVTARAGGSASIIAKTKDGGLTAVCYVSVVSANCVIYYTSSNGEIVTPNKTDVFGANIVSNTYENGKGRIIFDATVTSIGEYAFYGFSSLTSVTIGNGVTSIGECAFEKCASLTSVTIPDSVTSIGNYAFEDCTSLTSVTIPDSVTSIGNLAFYGCSSLTSVTIPDSVTSIGNSAFTRCTSLRAFYGKFASSDNRCLIVDGVLNLFAPAGLTEYTIPNGVTSIGNHAFDSCTSLTSVTIPDSVTSIGDCAFSGCTSLTSVTIPDSVTSIGNWAFYVCSSLTSVTIPNSVTSIGKYAFSNCTSLKTVYCNATTPPTLGDNAFENNATDRLIFVPKASYETYCAASGWSDYKDYITYEGDKKSLRVGDLVTYNGVKGVVFYATPAVVKIVSVNSTKDTWGVYGTTTYATDNYDGTKNMAKIKSIDPTLSSYPAFKWCAEQGEGWYLPAFNELKEIYNNRSAINSTLSANGYASLGTSWYWSSTEYSSSYAYKLFFYDGSSDYSYKDNTGTVRAILAF